MDKSTVSRVASDVTDAIVDISQRFIRWPCGAAEKQRIRLVGCFRFNGPLRQYFSLYQAVTQREGERGEKGQMRAKMSK